jgi:alanine racemase
MMVKERTWAIINLDNLRRNFTNIRDRCPGVKILGAVKADAYGHGGFEISRLLSEEGIDMLGVASLEEAQILKEIGIPIIILSPSTLYDIPDIVGEGFIPTVTYDRFAERLQEEAEKQGKFVKIHIEVDTGMGRTGVYYKHALEFIKKIRRLPNIRIEGVFTHFAESEKEDKIFTMKQIERFNRLKDKIERSKMGIPFYHTANTAAILTTKKSYFNMIRPGLLLYGMYPDKDIRKTIRVEPIMSLKSRICYLKWLPRGSSVSYGRTYITKKRTRVATLSIGYGDGYPRRLSNKGWVLIRGQRVPVIGNVCMDLTMIDVTSIKDIAIGDEVTIIGRDGNEEITAAEVARNADTINYEITTNIGPRVPRIYVENGRPTKRKSLITGDCLEITA